MLLYYSGPPRSATGRQKRPPDAGQSEARPYMRLRIFRDRDTRSNGAHDRLWGVSVASENPDGNQHEQHRSNGDHLVGHMIAMLRLFLHTCRCEPERGCGLGGGLHVSFAFSAFINCTKNKNA